MFLIPQTLVPLLEVQLSEQCDHHLQLSNEIVPDFLLLERTGTPIYLLCTILKSNIIDNKFDIKNISNKKK